MKEVSNKINFPVLEAEILQFWKDQKIFEKSVNDRPQAEDFVFYDGPPFATGLPHYGHLLAGTIKDVIPRYKTMQGYRVERRFGWDCHGLPVEFEMEKTLNLQGRQDIEAFGVGNFNEECRKIVLRYTNEWRSIVERMGRWVDFDHDYKTMDLSFMESVWWVFKQMWDQGLIYEGRKVVPYSWRVATPLSNFEANLNYKEVQDPSITIKCKCLDEENAYFLAWTTTPWTLPSNLALCVGPELEYVRIRHMADGNIYYLGHSRLDEYFGDDEVEVLSHFKGSELAGRKYEPLFDFASKHIDTTNCFQMLVDDYVSDDSGTGIVHQAPAFGEDDLRICQNAEIPVFDPVSADGNFIEAMDFIAGKNIKEADKLVIRRLKEEGKLFRQDTLAHSYPFCWRTDTPLIYKAISTWFVKVEAIKERMVRHNQSIHWVPHHIKDGRFGKWLENARDWAISRNRYWGTPLPIWKSEDGEVICFGSVAELEQATGKSIDDIHKHFVDEFSFTRDGKTFHRIPEVLDCWFESGSMPYAQQHYPFENKELFEKNFPADFICEGLDQTRGWFYTLMVIAPALFDQPAFRNVIVNGLVLAEDGKKMSKRLKNYPDPVDMLDKYGADAIRLYMLNSVAVRADDLKFAESGLLETTRNILLPLWNALAFLSTYASIDHWEPQQNPEFKPQHPLDRWIFSRLHGLIEIVSTNLNEYELNRSVAPFVGFIDVLTNWYIRRSRRRFWKSGDNADKLEAYQTLYTVLLELSKVIAPFIPFIAEGIFQSLKRDSDAESVHLERFPATQAGYRDLKLEHEMDLILSSVNLGRSLRSRHQIKIRQPLSKITLITRDPDAKDILRGLDYLIQEELNVKTVEIAENEEELVNLSAKANFKVLGPRFGKRMKTLAQQVTKLSTADIIRLQAGESTQVELEGEMVELTAEDVLIQRSEKEGMLVLTEDALTVALDTKLTDELINEGFAREFINKVQNMRKEQDLNVMDRIHVMFHSEEELVAAIKGFSDFIKAETLAEGITHMTEQDQPAVWDINGKPCSIQIQKVG